MIKPEIPDPMSAMEHAPTRTSMAMRNALLAIITLMVVRPALRVVTVPCLAASGGKRETQWTAEPKGGCPLSSVSVHSLNVKQDAKLIEPSLKPHNT